MNRSTVLSKLNTVWSCIDTEDIKKTPCVTRHDITPLIQSEVSWDSSLRELHLLVDENTHCFPTTSVHYPQPGKEDPMGTALSLSNQSGELPVEYLFNAEAATSTLTVNYYCRMTKALCVALDIAPVDDEFWERQFARKLTPLNAIELLLLSHELTPTEAELDDDIASSFDTDATDGVTIEHYEQSEDAVIQLAKQLSNENGMAEVIYSLRQNGDTSLADNLRQLCLAAKIHQRISDQV